MSAILCPVSLQTIFRDGRPMVGAKVLMYEAGTTTPKTVYQDSIMQAAHPRPILTDAQGMIPPIYIGRGDYKIRVMTAGNVIISEIDGLPGAAAASDLPDPGETYPLTDPNSILATGDIIAAFRTGSKAGFARCNGNTIGNSYSAASEIPLGEPSNGVQPLGSTYKLFIHLWELQEIGLKLPIYANGVEVSRGSTAISDWDNNRQIGLPDFRGRVAAGLDGMGGPVSNRLQLKTELTTTSGSIEAYVTNNSGIVAGMSATGTGLRDGTTITAVDGLKLTLSLPAKASTSAQTLFSAFGDANVLGASYGQQNYILTQGQIPEHKHGATTAIKEAGNHNHDGTTHVSGSHQHLYGDFYLIQGGVEIQGGGGGGIRQEQRTSTTAADGNHAHYFVTNGGGSHIHNATTTIENTGKSQSYSVLQPTILLSWYIKL